MIYLLMPLTLAAYFMALFHLSRRASQSGAQGNEAFFRAGRKSPWWLVSFGMIGASISGVTFISVPGWAKSGGMTYLQMCMGFVVGYALVAAVLLPLYYKLHLTSIYAYLGTRFGRSTHRIGALFFVLSKLTGAAARLYLVCMVLYEFVLRPVAGNGFLPFLIPALGVPCLIWLYTRRSGIQALVRTDVLQTICLLLAAIGIWLITARLMHLDFFDTLHTVSQSPMCRVWEWDMGSKNAFWRQFLSGIFIVIAMTGLDQDMMQKNLTCRSLRDAQKNMLSYGAAFIPVNALFLGLGILLYTFAENKGLSIPTSGDALLPFLVSSGELGSWVIIPFSIGVVAAAFSSADSALTALTTTVCIDLLRVEQTSTHAITQLRIRRRVHVGMALAFATCIIIFRLAQNDNILHVIYTMAGYTYGPLLGLYAYGLFTRRGVTDRLVPSVCIASPVVCGLLDAAAPHLWGYTFGYELLMLNGLLTFAGLWLTGCVSHPDSDRSKSDSCKQRNT